MTELSLIINFCESGNVKHLAKLNQKHAVLLRRLAAHSLTVPGSKKEIAKTILEYYNCDKSGRVKLFNIKHNLKKAEERFSKLSVSVTGARAGDILTGASKGSEGAVLKLHSHDVPPEKTRLDSIRAYPDLWDRFLIKLGSIPFFESMTPLSREVWLEMHEVSNEMSLGGEGGRLELVQPGTSQFATLLPEEELDMLMQGNPNSEDGYWSYADIESLFPGKPGSKATRHTLILIRTFWRIAVDYEVLTSFDGACIDVTNGKVTESACADKGEEIFVLPGITNNVVKLRGKWVRKTGQFGTQKIGMLVSKNRFPVTDIPILANSVVTCDFQKIAHSYRNFPPSAYKSLLQKIIRFRPTKVVLKNSKPVSAEQAFIVCISLLAMNPGVFVPDIQRYVTGIESMAKRIGISIYEDSSLPGGNEKLMSLMSGSLLAQRARSWKPDEKLLKQWMISGLNGWEETSAVVVDYNGEVPKKPYTIDSGNTVLENASAVIDELRSFPTDLGLARGWARNYPDFTVSTARSTPDIMYLEHCVDHHWAPGLVHYFTPDFVKRVTKGSTSGKPFDKLFRTIWDECSSINPRKHHINFDTYETRPNVVEIRIAQSLYLTALQTVHKPRHNTGGVYKMKYVLSDSWIAAMVGVIDIKVSRFPSMMVTLAGDDPLRLLVIRTPSRNMSVEPLTPEEEDVAIESAKHRLRVGIKLSKTKLPDISLEGHSVYLIEEPGEEPYYAVGKPGDVIRPWDEARELDISVPILKEILPTSIQNSLTYVSIGVEENSDESLLALIDDSPSSVVYRSLVYISTFDRVIEMNRVGRDGGGTYHAVTLDDVAAYQFLLRLSTIYPAGLAPAEYKPSRFIVHVGPLLWHLREKISQIMIEKSYQNYSTEIKEKSGGWDSVRMTDESRTLWKHQASMVDDMIRNNKIGNKGNFLWVTVGLGKTASVLTFLKYLKNVRKLPPYIFYTLPESAIKSIIDEIKLFDIPVNIIIPLKDIRKRRELYTGSGITISQNCIPVAYAINLIEHDHLKKCEDTLLEYATRSYLIVDEVHKTLNDTKRTSVALEVAHLSSDFVVLTGTPVIDSNTHKLLPWLKQVVPYEVNSVNFWVAANSMIAKKINTGIKVVDEELVAVMDKKEGKEYMSLVPPVLGGTNPNPTSNDWRAATDICYDVATQEMVALTVGSVKGKKGVMLVAKDKKHQEVMRKLLVKNGIKDKDIYLLVGGDSISLTDDSVKAKTIHDYKVVIVPISKSAGYNLTRLTVMITSVYPSNNATRIQLRGRIDRISQNNKTVWYKTVHTGILTSILRNHNAAKNLTVALEGLAQTI
jgi:hypothetical protein